MSANSKTNAHGMKPDVKDLEAERLLAAWIDVSTAIRNERFVSELTYNESIICRLIAQAVLDGGEGLTATDLCQTTKMKKSQMNRTLSSLEEQGLISRRQSDDDKRRQIITINQDRMQEFDTQHSRIIAFVRLVLKRLGEERSLEITGALEDLSRAVREAEDGG